MAQFYEMPAVSPTMEVGTLVAWKVAEGASFESGTILAEVGTDKANMDAEIFDTGVLIKHLIPEGAEVPAGYPIAIWGKSKDEDVSGLLKEFETRKAAAPAKKAEAAPAESPPAEAPAAKAPEAAKPAEKGPSPAKPAEKSAPGATKVARDWSGKAIQHDFYDPPGDLRFGLTPGRVLASPLARKIAADKGVDLSKVAGSGPGGRVVAADVEGAGARAVAAPAAAPDEVVRNTPMRKTIARRLLESHQQIPTFYLTTSFDMTAVAGLRETLKAKLPDEKVSVNDVLVAAVARALRKHPEVNASWGNDAITRHSRIDIGIAVALPQGLITPVVRDADKRGLASIASEIRALASRAREQKLAPEEYTGGTFTISNLGMMEIEHFTAIINPPEAAILAVGAMATVPVAQKDGTFKAGLRMTVTMTCDHRVIDGAMGAAFLQTLRTYVEAPVLLLA
jgi:pyruvate dehydrogenase E2 component (dihydrolipoamide acetyltransferase)